MNGIDIKRYSYNAPTRGIEAKTLDYLWDKAEQTTIAHRAEFYQLIWVEQGVLRVSVDFENLHIGSSQALLITPGQVCQFSLDSYPRAYGILFVPEFLGEASSDMQLLRQVSGISTLSHCIISLEGLPIGGLIQQLIHELSRPNDPYQEIVSRSCLRIVLAEIARRVVDTTPRASSHLAERFFDLVEEHYKRLYHVQEYLPLLATQEKPLSQVVRQAVGMSPKAYIDLRRTLEAKRLLAYSPVSVKEIGFALGFDEPTNFNKFFRKHSGQSPNEFRQSLAPNIAED